MLPNKRLHALLFLLVLFPLWWIQRVGASDLHSKQATPTSGGSTEMSDGGDGDDDSDDESDDGDGDDGDSDDDSDDGDDDGDDDDDTDDDGDNDDCGDGCTLTQGYWKNHSAHADNPSQQIPWPISEETLLCGETWFNIINTPPSGGNAWLILAHQWIAAELNAASGASTEALGDALDDAGDLLADNCGGIGDDQRGVAIALAGTLGNYNEGDIGPGHCGDPDHDDGCEITDCNGNGIDDSIDISEGTSRDNDEDGIPDECQPGSEPFCEGEGTEAGGVQCPCGNNAPPGSGTGCLNRNGVGALLTSTGVPSVSNDTFVLHVIGLPNGVAGFFFQGGTDAGPGTFGNGIRCIGGPFVRMAKIAGQPGGNQFPPPGGTPISEQFNIPAGATRYYQVLYRDGGGPCGASINASNGLRVVWGL